MQKILALIVAATVIGAAGSAMAIPTAYYNPTTGGIWLKNDTAGALGAISVITTDNSVKTDASAFASVNGTTFDPGDLPLGFTYLSYPVTPDTYGLAIGNVITAGTPAANLSVVYYASLSNPVAANGAVVVVPEPATIAMGGLGLVGVVAAMRRRKA